MMNVGQYLELLSNMGWRYAFFRAGHELRLRTGRLKRRFPVNPSPRSIIDLPAWRKDTPAFFFSDKQKVAITKRPSELLRQNAQDILTGRLLFFSATKTDLGPEMDWLLNVSNGFRYDGKKHWTEIPDFHPQSGDIKYVWEPSRFSWLYALIRDDYHNGQDHGAFIFASIDSWIEHNPINQGPNWRCSQEISLRMLNWTFALYYYKNHTALTPERFDRILHVIYWQLRHVYAHIHFSRIAVRNNHAITETLMLYLGGLLFPFFPEAKRWKSKGKTWFEQEIAYQVYEDGAYLQHSFNYQRVVVQLLSWAFALAHAHGERFQAITYHRAGATLKFLLDFQFGSQGELPNYGHNDGALFFPLSQAGYTDFRPALNALHAVIEGKHAYAEGPWREEADWYLNGKEVPRAAEKPAEKSEVKSLPYGGYYLLSTLQAQSLVRCARFRDRPAQADNLHWDLWIGGENVLRDAGTYQYNVHQEVGAHFFGTKGHNTATLGGKDQMRKGSRFIWFHWSKALYAGWTEYPDYWEFQGAIQAFAYLAKGIEHRRTIRQFKGELRWEITDQILHDSGLPVCQHWHPSAEFTGRLAFEAMDEAGRSLAPVWEDSWYSRYYGRKEQASMLTFSTPNKQITTTLRII